MKRFYYIVIILVWGFFLNSCIHEYPTGNGVDPSAIEATIELEIALSWTQSEEIAIFTKARNENARAIVEIRKEGALIGRDEFIVGENDIKEGKLRHKLSVPLHALKYEIGVWYETFDSQSGNYRFNAANLNGVSLASNEFDWNSDIIAGYSSDVLDLRNYKGKWGVKVEKDISLRHAGGRFKLITTDMKSFVKDQIDEIERGETYFLTVNLKGETANSFDVFSGTIIKNFKEYSYVTDLIPTYSIIEETPLSEGFLFCEEEQTVTMSVSVQNSARLTIVRSTDFSFPVKRGNLTIVKGAFLSEKISNFLWVDTKWDEEIVIDL